MKGCCLRNKSRESTVTPESFYTCTQTVRRYTLKLSLLTIGSFALLAATAAASAQTSTDFGGTRYQHQVDATHTRTAEGTLHFDIGAQVLSFTGKDQQAVSIPYGEIESMRLENTVNRLRRPFTEHVGREQFLTIEYGERDKASTYAVFKLKGKSYRVAALETQTKKPVEVKAD